MRKNEVVVGLSGGVDSSMALYFLKKQGWEPLGVSLLFSSWESGCQTVRENSCCTQEALKNASEVCEKLGVPHYVVDAKSEFERGVVGYFLRQLAAGRTPNPCNFCNRDVKIAALIRFADERGIKYVATGHYAAICRSRGRPALARPKDAKKDQTYGLCLLPHRWLSRLVFPLADKTKQEVYDAAIKEGFGFYRKIPQSQDLCFVSGNEMRSFLREKLGERRGPVIEQESGRLLGRHDGVFHYTIGQRRGLRFPFTYFVCGFDLRRNAVFVTRERGKLLKGGMQIEDFNPVSGIGISKPLLAEVQIHPHQKPIAARINPKGKGALEVWLNEPIEGVAPGQICAIYRGRICLGGGVIADAL
ncbi:MAG: tRNA 2-thiouridine(34) synthase MnmA [Candidatus Micrarchaeota archaeon]|nr:tRNA 2-thiouridine(34) synthase MnmA [Candidatus Micrarchaeota archaeon]